MGTPSNRECRNSCWGGNVWSGATALGLVVGGRKGQRQVQAGPLGLGPLGQFVARIAVFVACDIWIFSSDRLRLLGVARNVAALTIEKKNKGHFKRALRADPSHCKGFGPLTLVLTFKTRGHAGTKKTA